MEMFALSSDIMIVGVEIMIFLVMCQKDLDSRHQLQLCLINVSIMIYLIIKNVVFGFYSNQSISDFSNQPIGSLSFCDLLRLFAPVVAIMTVIFFWNRYKQKDIRGMIFIALAAIYLTVLMAFY